MNILEQLLMMLKQGQTQQPQGRGPVMSDTNPMGPIAPRPMNNVPRMTWYDESPTINSGLQQMPGTWNQRMDLEKWYMENDLSKSLISNELAKKHSWGM